MVALPRKVQTLGRPAIVDNVIIESLIYSASLKSDLKSDHLYVLLPTKTRQTYKSANRHSR